MSDENSAINYEKLYESQADLNHRKKFGQFFTPRNIAAAMAEWVLAKKPTQVFDPAVGSGVLLDEALKRSPTISVIGYDIDPELLKLAKQQLPTEAQLDCVNYLETEFNQKFDAITANPPYVRHHDFEAADTAYKKWAIKEISKLSNLYILFLSKILDDLSDLGRAAILIPSDWATSNFGVSLRRYIVQNTSLSRAVFFDTKGQVFDDNLSTGCLLFFDKSKRDSYVDVINVDSTWQMHEIRALGATDRLSFPANRIRKLDVSQLDPKKKWLSIMQGHDQTVSYSAVTLRELATSKRGIATGANEYFLISKSSYEFSELSASFRICIGRSKDIRGLIFTLEDAEDLEISDIPIRLLDLTETNPADSAYISAGEVMGLPKRYLLAQRKPWYAQERRATSDILVGVFGRDGVRFIENSAKVSTLTCFHNLYINDNSFPTSSLVALLNSTIVQDSMRSNTRSYGTGLTKVEPKDILDIRIPDPRLLDKNQHWALSEALTASNKMLRINKERWRAPIDEVVYQILDSK